MRLVCILALVLALAIVAMGCSNEQQQKIGRVPSVAKMKAEQVEAQQLLNQVFRMQQVYHSANRRYASSLDDIGVTIPPGARYSYSVTSSGSSWSCAATANLDLDATVDTWVVDQNGVAVCTSDDALS